MNVLRTGAALVAVCLLSGCLGMRSYVDPQLHDLDWSAVRAPAQAHATQLDVEFFRNGERYARADKVVRGAVERAFAKSGVLAVQADGPGRITVRINNVANVAEAMKKGFGTGLTLGAKGSAVTDGYEITVRYEHDGRTLEKAYRHALHSTVGHAGPATAATPMALVQAFDQVIEDAVIHFLRDAQRDGVLVHRATRITPAA